MERLVICVLLISAGIISPVLSLFSNGQPIYETPVQLNNMHPTFRCAISKTPASLNQLFYASVHSVDLFLNDTRPRIIFSC